MIVVAIFAFCSSSKANWRRCSKVVRTLRAAIKSAINLSWTRWSFATSCACAALASSATFLAAATFSVATCWAALALSAAAFASLATISASLNLVSA